MAFFPLTQFDFPNATFYDSNLREILYKLKELISNYNEVVSAFNAIQEQFDAFKVEMELLPETIRAEVEAQLAEITPGLYEHIDDEIAGIKVIVDSLSEQIIAIGDNVKLRLDNMEIAWRAGDTALDSKFVQITEKQRREYLNLIQQINADLENLQWDLPKIYNIAKGTHDNITKVLYDVYDAVRVHAICAGLYDSLSLSAAEYDNNELTTIQFDVESKHYLADKMLINVVTGERDTLQNILFDIMAYATGDLGITAGNYDYLELEAEIYDSFGLAAYDYDYFASLRIT